MICYQNISVLNYPLDYSHAKIIFFVDKIHTLSCKVFGVRECIKKMDSILKK